MFEVGAADARGMSRITQRKVKTGRTRGEQIEVLSGIEAESSLVLSGGAFLNDGDTVKIVTRKAGA